MGQTAIRTGALLALVVCVVGCAKEQDYFDVMRDQQGARMELVEVLKSVKDGPSMAAAKRKLEENTERYEAIARRADALPKPPPPKVQERAREEIYFVNETIKQLRAETKRISDLPGGADLLKQFESTKGLLTAVQQ